MDVGLHPGHYWLGGKKPRNPTPKQNKSERVAWQRKGKWGRRHWAGRQQGKWPEETGAVRSARKGLLEWHIPVSDAVGELRILNDQALRDIPIHGGRKWSLKKTIKHIDLIYWSVDGVDRKAVMQFEEVEIMQFVIKGQLISLSCVLAILYVPIESMVLWPKPKQPCQGHQGNQGIEQMRVPHMRAFVVRQVHCFFAFLFVLNNHT